MVAHTVAHGWPITSGSATSGCSRSMPTDEQWMRRALELASRCAEHGDVPIGAVVVRDDREIGAAGNERELRGDPTAHAEILAVRRRGRGRGRAGGWTAARSYVTLEPCAMCAGAIVLARLERVVFGAADPKAGFAGSLGNLGTGSAAQPRGDAGLRRARRGVRRAAASVLPRASLPLIGGSDARASRHRVAPRPSASARRSIRTRARP